MILIADCGSTKIDWCLLNGNEKVAQIFTTGMNALMLTKEEMTARIHDELMPHIMAYKVDEIFYYGAGIISDEIKGNVVSALKTNMPAATRIEVESDLLAAARALCGHKPGIACILGTGSNSCLYDGKEIVKNVPPLGYILGDEGSGAVLGKFFFNALFKGFLPKEMLEEYLEKEQLTYAEIIERVYRKPLANRFLASTSHFIASHLDSEPLRELVKENFRGFFRRNVMQYGRPDLEVGIVGSIAHVYRKELTEVAREENIKLNRIVQSPIDLLVERL